jgi:predicted glycogen debranching enzyme
MTREWLETDGLCGFASGPVAGGRTRRYHAYLLVEVAGTRYVLVNGADVELETATGKWPLSTQSYAGGVEHPQGERFLEAFAAEPWPTWRYATPDGTIVEQALFVRHGRRQTFVSWRLISGGPAVLRVRLLMSGRNYHALHQQNPDFRFHPETDGHRLRFRPYDGVPPVIVAGNGVYRHDPQWYQHFHYADEAARGLDHEEDLASPGELRFELTPSADASLILGTDEVEEPAAHARGFESERRRGFRSPLHRAADAYLVRRGGQPTILAGYPWFTDWGRDTFISLRGLCLASGRLADARAILLRWATVVSNGMLPNRFPDDAGALEYNSVDAALWFVIAVHDLVNRGPTTPADRALLFGAVEAILQGYVTGTRHDICGTEDGLLAAGEPGVQLTWMDAKIGDWVVTPRIGKPVEVQALWLNALWIGHRLRLPSEARWLALHTRGRASFEDRFWNAAGGFLHDVIDCDHVPGKTDPSFRPNQIFAVGGLPVPLLDGARARAVVDAVEQRLLTPMGLRTLAPDDPSYNGRYEGGVLSRDAAYHQGTAWPWLLGPFAEAWVRVRGQTPAVKREAHQRFVLPLFERLDQAGIGHISEVASGDPPHLPGGSPFQAWSLGELMRLDLDVLRER